MKAREIMTPNPACCTPETGLREVAQMFVEYDCGAIPVVSDLESRQPLGIVTDRDIACRAIAAGKNALELKASDCMSRPCVSVSLDVSLDGCCEAMEKHKVRRLLVVDEAGRCVGVIAQADIALKGKERKATEVLKEVSRPTVSASAVPV
jgi:CBS domain-containing protein